MKLTDDELLGVIDEVTIALGEILLRHRNLRESLLATDAVSASQDRIEKRRTEIEKEREKIRKTRETIQRRRELERISKQHKDDANKKPQNEAGEGRSGITAIINQRGQVIGYRQESGRQTNYLTAGGKLVAREVGGHTYDGRGGVSGRGKQGLRILGQTCGQR